MSCGIATGPNASLAFAPESTLGVAATSGFTLLRATKRNINFEATTITTNEVRPDRQISDVRLGFRSVKGTIGGEMSYQSWTTFINAGTVNPAAGAEIPSFTIVRRFTDVTEFQSFVGCVINTIDISLKPEQMATLDFGILGMNGLPFSATDASATPAAATTTTPVSGFDGLLLEGGVALGVVTGIDIKVDNQRTLQGVVGSTISPCVFEGRLKVTGTASVMFKGVTMFNKFINETESSIVVTLTDALSTPGTPHTMTWTLPRVKYLGASMDPPTEGPVVMAMPFQALVDITAGSPTLGKTIVYAEA